MPATRFAKSFGILPDGRPVSCYALHNKNGVELEVINYGAAISSLKIPVAFGKKVDVVLGFENSDDYVNSFELPSAPYFGAVVGRYAGRISEAQFVLDNRQIKLTKNHQKHQLHGGHEGFSKAFWSLIEITTGDNPSIVLEYISNDGEENFPGILITQITYTLTETNELKIAFAAKTSEDTIINLTQHSYFNLDGHAADLATQEVSVSARQILETTDENIPTGNFISLDGHPFDFVIPKKCPQAIDNTFVLQKENLIKATLYSVKNNLKMSVLTNQPAIHLYVGGNCFGQIKGKNNADYHSASGICFEAQNFPDAPNHPHFPGAVLKKGETYDHQTTFKFEIL